MTERPIFRKDLFVGTAEYYDRFFGSDAYGPAHAEHMSTWHR